MKLLDVIQIFIILLVPVGAFAQPADPLSPWMDGRAKQAIMQFVKDVTDIGSRTGFCWRLSENIPGISPSAETGEIQYG